MAKEKSCFVIMPIGEADSDTRKRSDQVLKHIIRPAVESCGYKAVRADEIDKPGIITSQVIQHVVNDPLVVADLTERNSNVFYELAIRHALRRPFVQLIKKGERIPFDVAGTRTVHFDHQDLDSVEAAKNSIVEQIKALEKDTSAIETPISVSLDLQLLRASEKPEERSLADLIAAVSDLRTSLSKMETKIGTKGQEGILDEIQSTLQILPRKLDEYFESSPSSPWLRQRRRFHPMMLMELTHGGPRRSPALGILFIASFFKDSMPWVYELGLETYRIAKRGNRTQIQGAIEEFRHVVEFSVRGPMGREFLGRDKAMMMLVEELEPLLERVTRMVMDRPSPKKEPGTVDDDGA